jgi:chromosome segregation ATPase
MSASVSNRPNQSRSQASSSIDGAGAGMLNQLEELVNMAKRLEHALRDERSAKEKLAADLKTQAQKHEQALEEERAKSNEFVARERKYQAAIHSFQENEKTLNEKIRQMSVELTTVRTELHKYQQAWAMVLEREREAKMIIQESKERAVRLNESEEKLKKLGEELLTERKARDQAERHNKNYQNELQSTLVRLHSSEARFTELSKEFQAVNQAKRNVDNEIKKVEETIRERYRWEFIREREKLKAEMEKNAIAEREAMREEIRQSVMTEYERRLNLERERAVKTSRDYIQEIGRLKAELDTARRQYSSQIQLAQKEATETTQRFMELSERMDNLRKEAREIRTTLPAAEKLTEESTRLKAELDVIDDKYREEIVALQERLLAKNQQSTPPAKK